MEEFDLSKASKLGNKECDCGSGKKYKKCCYKIELEKREIIRK